MKRAQILSASAGSGKTFRLVLKYICDIINNPECYRNILAVTFTNKATEEMKSRIINEIHRLASNQTSQYIAEIIKHTQLSEPLIRAKALKARTRILHDYSRFTVLTIDRFFQRILRAFINELSLDLNYNIELDTSLLLERSADTLIESITTDPDIKRWLLEFAEERLNEGSTWDMRKDLRELGKELFKNGIAKRVSDCIDKQQLSDIIDELVKHDNVIIQRIKNVAKEAVEYMSSHGLSAGDFKGGSRSSFVTHFARHANGELPQPTDTLIKATDDINEWYVKSASDNVKACATVLMPKLKEIYTLYSENIEKINTTKLLRSKYRSFALLADLYNNIDSICKQENIMVLDKTKEILSEFIDHNNAPFIYEKVGNRYDRYMIDEFQDTSTREWRNLLPLLNEALSSNPDASVFIVGDIKQSIYRWRGGDWRLLNSQVIEDLGEDNTEVIHLKPNYRSLKNIVDFNRKFIDHVVERDNDYLDRFIADALSSKKISQATHDALKGIMKRAYVDNEQTAVTKSEEQGIVEVTLYDDKICDSPFIEAIEDAIARGYNYRDILILVRGETDSKKVADALYAYKKQLLERDSKAGFNILTYDSLTINSSDIVTFIIAVLRLAINPCNDIERGTYNHFLGLPFYHTFSNDEQALFHTIAHLSPIEAFEVIIERFKLNANTTHIAYIQAMHEQIISFSSSHIADIQHYLEWWEERGCNETLSVEMTDDTIEITTIHKAKGLERDVVIIPYARWSMVPMANTHPIVWATADAKSGAAAKIGSFPVMYGSAMEDSAFSEGHCNELVMSHVDGVNMLYVAITRAAKELYMYVPKRLNTKSSSKAEKITDTTTLIADAVANMCEPHPEFNEEGKTIVQRYTYGEKIKHHTPKQRAGSNNIILQDYPSHQPNVAIYYTNQRYSEEGLKAGSSERRNGIMLHRVFEKAANKEDIYTSIKRLTLDGLIGTSEAEQLRNNIERAMSKEHVSEWFEGSWDDIKSEAEILTTDGILRPDRVMIKGSRAVVVDYKFGNKTNKQYNAKMKRYIELLRDMGLYTDIEGYIWYINLGIVESV